MFESVNGRTHTHMDAGMTGGVMWRVAWCGVVWCMYATTGGDKVAN